MKIPIKYYFTLLAVVLLLNGCQKNISVSPTAPLEKQIQDAVIEKCLAIQEAEADREYVFLFSQLNDVAEEGWRKIGDTDIGKEETLFRALSDRKSEDAREIILENNSPSGDWYRIDSYCFNGNDRIAELYSDLRTSYSDDGPIQVIRTWKYYSDGSLESEKTEFFDLNTKKPVAQDSASYMDNPPQLVKDYEELANYLELPQQFR